MRPAEIMLSESQERMLLEVAPEDVEEIGAIAERYDLRWRDIGEVIPEPQYQVLFQGEMVCDLPIHLLTSGTPVCLWETEPYEAETPFRRPSDRLKDLIFQVLSHTDVAGKEWVYEQYDHDVQVRTIQLGRDAAVLRLVEESALVLSCGCNPRHIYLAPFQGTANAVLENASNLACYGAEPLCLVNCLNFASPVHPTIYWQLEQSVQGLGAMAQAMEIPVVGGNVSLYNESDEFGTQIKPTPSIGMVGRGSLSIPPGPEEGQEIVLVGEGGPHLGGSVLDAVSECGGRSPPTGDPVVVTRVRRLVEKGSVRGITDLSHGGLIGALATFSPRAKITLPGDLLLELFTETYGRFLLAGITESDLKGLPYRIIGEVGGEALRIRGEREEILLTDAEIRHALGSLTQVMRHSWL